MDGLSTSELRELLIEDVDKVLVGISLGELSMAMDYAHDLVDWVLYGRWGEGGFTHKPIFVTASRDERDTRYVVSRTFDNYLPRLRLDEGATSRISMLL